MICTMVIGLIQGDGLYDFNAVGKFVCCVLAGLNVDGDDMLFCRRRATAWCGRLYRCVCFFKRQIGV